MLNFLSDYLKIFRPRTFKKAVLYFYHTLKLTNYLLKGGKFKEAYNIFWVRFFSIEEGLGLSTPFYKLSPKLAPYPERIEVEVTNKCRFRCPKCEHSYWREKISDMSFDNFKKIIDQFPKLKAISLTGIGHGFENPEYFKILEYSKSKSIFVQFFDPLFLLDEPILRQLIKIGVNWIWMSMDGATKESYEKSIVGSNFERVIANVKTLVRLKNEMKSPFPELHFQPIITKYNANELPKFVELFGEITKGTNQPLTQVQFIKLIPFKENEWLAPEISGDVLRQAEEVAKKFKHLYVSFVRMGSEFQKQPISECVAWTVPFITVEGDVYPCCTLTEGNIRSQVKPYVLGNVLEKDFHEIWNSPKYKSFRKMIHQGAAPWLCWGLRECTFYNCPKNQKTKC